MNLLTGPHTKTLLRTVLSERGIRLRRRFGQNFLIDQNILQFLVNAAQICADDVILEVGTGTGALTSLLAEKAQMVFSVEIDTGLFKLASEVLQSYRNIRLINKDILSSKNTLEPQVESELLSFKSLQKKSVLKVVSNLPYSISTPLIIKLLEGALPIELMVLTLQKDIVNRLVAQPATKDYGILSIAAQLSSNINVVKKLPPEVFWPTPKVESAVVIFHVHKERFSKNISNYELFQKIVRTIFESRRKIIVNSFTRLKPPLISKEHLLVILRRLGIAPSQRGETLTPEQFTRLSEEINTFLMQH
ncbi:MAG: 16S rRNA (adenine(1518)-N(6)/adenine(1519)-N(6))-dimethyltransferase RsmA [Candidatus Brocadiales bacterium]